MAGFRIEGNTSGNVLEVDANNRMLVSVGTDATTAGTVNITSNTRGTYTNKLEITEEGQAYATEPYTIFDLNFNSNSSVWSSKINTNATTLTKGTNNGYMRLNNGAVTTTATGISIYSNRVFYIQEASELRIRIYAKHTNITATNKQIELGLGYYNFAAGQANQMNEFIGFRWTTAGGLLGVVGTSFGGAPTEQTININSNVPYSDAIIHEYELIVTESKVHFYVDGTYQGTINNDPTAWSLTKGIALPFIARQFHSGATSAACTFDIGAVNIRKAGCFDNQTFSAVQAAQGLSSYFYQPDFAVSAATHSIPASGTAPTANPGSNTVSAANSTTTLGGLIRQTLTGVTTTLSSNILWTGYQNTSLPTAAGQATNARNFYVTAISISPMVVTTALVGGGFTVGWFAAIGASALSLATTDADGTTSSGAKAPRYIPLSLVSTLAATAPLGTVATDVGDHTFIFPTPLPILPGEFIAIAMRTLAVTAAVTQGSADAMININGYWE